MGTCSLLDFMLQPDQHNDFVVLALNIHKVSLGVDQFDILFSGDVMHRAMYIYIYIERNIGFISVLHVTFVFQFLLENLKRPKQLAIDWIHHHIYWTDHKTRLIERVDLGGSDRVAVVGTANRRPNAIAVDPFKGYDWLALSLALQLIRTFHAGYRFVIKKM